MRTLYICLSICAALLALCFEENFLPTSFYDTTPESDYLLSVISLAVTFGGVFGALRLFKFEKVQKELNAIETDIAFAAYRKWNTLRIILIFIPIYYNLIVYYGVGYNTSAMYCMLIAIIGALFCWPTQKN